MHLQGNPVDILVRDPRDRAAGDPGLLEVLEDPLREKLRDNPRVRPKDLVDLLLDEEGPFASVE